MGQGGELAAFSRLSFATRRAIGFERLAVSAALTAYSLACFTPRERLQQRPVFTGENLGGPPRACSVLELRSALQSARNRLPPPHVAGATGGLAAAATAAAAAAA